MESLRDEPKLELEETRLSIDYAFVSVQQETWDEDFTIDSSVTKIAVYFKSSLFFSEETEAFGFDPRYVDVSIKDSNGNEVWAKRSTTTEGPPEEEIAPQENGKFLEGDWNLFIEASGQGLIGEDSFLVTITVIRTCVDFPPDYSECTESITL